MAIPFKRVTDMSAQAKTLTLQQNRQDRLAIASQEEMKAFTDGFMPPGRPITPLYPEGTPARRWDYQPSQNIQFTPRAGMTSFDLLDQMASWDVVRYCIEQRKNQIKARNWAIMTDDEETESMEKHKREIDNLTEYWAKPDGENSWHMWTSQLLEDSFKFDAATIFRWPTRDGKQTAQHVIVSGKTIVPKIDITGRTPKGDLPAYQQVIRGIVFAEFPSSSLIYAVRNPSTDSVYGMSEIEWLLLNINIALRRDIFELGYFTQGNVPYGFASAPKDWTGTQILEFSDKFNAMCAGNLGQRNKIIFGPEGFNFKEFTQRDPNEGAIKIQEFIVRRACAIFHVAPTAYVGQVNRATAEQAAVSQVEQADEPLIDWLENLITNEIKTVQGCPHLKLKFIEERAENEIQTATIHSQMTTAAIMSIDECRIARGLKPIGIPNGMMTPTGFVPLEGESEWYQEQYKDYFDKQKQVEEEAKAEQQAQMEAAQQAAAQAAGQPATDNTGAVGAKPIGGKPPAAFGGKPNPFAKKKPLFGKEDKAKVVEQTDKEKTDIREKKTARKLAYIDNAFKVAAEDERLTMETSVELDRWRRMVRNCEKSGKPIRTFKSDIIPKDICEWISERLITIEETIEAIEKGKTINASPFALEKKRKRPKPQRDPVLERIREEQEASLQQIFAGMFAEQLELALRTVNDKLS